MIQKVNSIIKNHTGQSFNDLELLEKALTHDSVGKEGFDFERMEFLGDACLDMHIAEMLMANPNLSEGQMSQIRANLTQKESLANIIRNWNINAFIKLGKSVDREELPDTIYADIFESILGALYIDSGFETSRKVIQKLYGSKIDDIVNNEEPINNEKSRLQEHFMIQGKELPDYQIVDKSGASHQPTYTIELKLHDGKCFLAKGNSIKSAEKKAARMALDYLEL